MTMRHLFLLTLLFSAVLASPRNCHSTNLLKTSACCGDKQGNGGVVLASNSDNQNYLTVGVDGNNPIPTTLYDLLTSDARFSILAGYINDDDELKETLADQGAALTFFAPINKALECLRNKEIPKEVIRRIFRYHVVNVALPYRSLIASRVLDTALNSSGLNDAPQKVRVSGWVHHARINWSRVKVHNLVAGNGYAYGIDHILIPPPDIMIELFIIPTFFSTLTSALQKVGLAETLETSKAITTFIPSNRAWARLGFRNLAYLFSPRGKDALTTILKYHISPQLAYSTDLIEDNGFPSNVPKKRHTELDTLAGLKLQIDATTYGRKYVKITVNGVRVLFKDVIAKNGVGHTIAKVLLPTHCHMYLPDSDYQTIEDESELMAEIDINEENEKLFQLNRKSRKHESKFERSTLDETLDII